MPRQYRLSEEGRARLASNARKGLAAIDSPDRMIARLEEREGELTLEQRDRLAGIGLRDEPNRDAQLSPEKIAEVRRLLGGGSR
ncbi:hypothetical protein [Streptomyces hokutonensis]|uniref:hypothetical protein n=1 Tax=Streptomyces hokutonensis TaxID=1306990 RepID=UPI00382B2DAE